MEANCNVWFIEKKDSPPAGFKSELIKFFPNTTFFALEEFADQATSLQPKPDFILSSFALTADAAIDTIKAYLAKNKALIWIALADCESKAEIQSFFEAGAHDYLSIPIHWNELHVKMERALSKKTRKETIRLREKQLAELTMKELRIYSALKKAHDFRLTREKIIKTVWGSQQLSSKSFDVHLFHLRKKLWKMGLQIRFLPTNEYQLVHTDKLEKKL